MDAVNTPLLPVSPGPVPVAPAAPPTSASVKAAAKSAHDFEAVFVGQMTKIMMETVETSGPFSGGHGEEMFRGVMAEQLGGVITARGGLGLAPAVMKQIIALQGGAQPAPAAVVPSAAARAAASPVEEDQSDAR